MSKEESSHTFEIPENEFQKRSYNANEIETIVKEIIRYTLVPSISNLRRTNMEEYKLNVMKKFGEFHYNCPSLFFTIIENPTGFPMYRLKEMLEMKRKIEAQEISNDEADKVMGEKYYNEFAGKYNFK